MVKKIFIQIALVASFIPLCSLVLAQETEPSNQFSNSLMLAPSAVYEDQNYQNESEKHQQFCRDLQKQISQLKNQPVRRSAAKERYQTECIGN
jgi:uncharacterized membrane protein YhiD involved in acid resistance